MATDGARNTATVRNTNKSHVEMSSDILCCCGATYLVLDHLAPTTRKSVCINDSETQELYPIQTSQHLYPWIILFRDSATHDVHSTCRYTYKTSRVLLWYHVLVLQYVQRYKVLITTVYSA